MHDPDWVASGRLSIREPLAQGNQALVLRLEEGRTRPSLAMSRFSTRFQPWIKPSQAKSASSQGGALATTESYYKQQLNLIEDMSMESLHD